MGKGIGIGYAKGKKDIEYFWRKRDEYFLRDIFPNCNLGDKLGEDDLEYFFSKEYKENFEMIFNRDTDPLFITFINKDNWNIGFMVYVIYNSEDGKCFIVDYCIYPQYRGGGLGKESYILLENEFLSKGATYINLNVSNTKNERFWIGNGFSKSKIKDEHNNFIYEKDLR